MALPCEKLSWERLPCDTGILKCSSRLHIILKVVSISSQKFQHPEVERLGPQRQGDAIERLCWAGPSEDREVTRSLVV